MVLDILTVINLPLGGGVVLGGAVVMGGVVGEDGGVGIERVDTVGIESETNIFVKVMAHSVMLAS